MHVSVVWPKKPGVLQATFRVVDDALDLISVCGDTGPPLAGLLSPSKHAVQASGANSE